jgi:hypothetical protein
MRVHIIYFFRSAEEYALSHFATGNLGSNSKIAAIDCQHLLNLRLAFWLGVSSGFAANIFLLGQSRFACERVAC